MVSVSSWEAMGGLTFEATMEDKETFGQVFQSEKWPRPKSGSVSDMVQGAEVGRS